ncbi:MAG: DUF4837 family protein [Bacteroidota bacterium]|nr:DUF4837 family protein [Bacteroidota bacterium]
MRQFFFLLSIAAAFIFISCNSRENPVVGIDDDIYVAIDKNDYNTLKPVLIDAFERTIYTPQKEKLFEINKISIDQIDKYRQKKNIVIAALLTSNSPTVKYIKANLSKEEYKLLNSGKQLYIKKENLWAKNQVVIFIASRNIDSLSHGIINHKDELVALFQKMSDKRFQSSIYDKKYEQKQIQGHLLKNYGWMLYVQPEYRLTAEDPREKYVLFLSNNKNKIVKVIFVHWFDNASPHCLTKDSIAAIRNNYVQKFNKHFSDSLKMTISINSSTSSEMSFKNHYAVLSQGLWDMNASQKGGPFINYAFYDEKTKRVYMIDGAVFAPKYYKKTLIKQIDGILQSFMTQEELSSDRKKELLESAR